MKLTVSLAIVAITGWPLRWAPRRSRYKRIPVRWEHVAVADGEALYAGSALSATASTERAMAPRRLRSRHRRPT